MCVVFKSTSVYFLYNLCFKEVCYKDFLKIEKHIYRFLVPYIVS